MKARRIPAPAADVTALRAPQLDLFPPRATVEALDPHAVVGLGTGVRRLLRVRLLPTAVPHMIFHDRHGWYCEAHGRTCAAVDVARDSSR